MKQVAFTDAYPELLEIAARRARRLLGDPGEADEVAQETLLRAYVSWEDIASYSPQWVARVAANLALTRLRRRRLVSFELPRAKGQTSVEERVDLTRAMAQLPLRQRQVTLLRFVSDLPEREVAELLGISSGAVKRHLHRAVQRLRSPAIGLAEDYASSEQSDQEELMKAENYQWADRWRKAAEPREGWPSVPWDHYYVRDDEGNADRIAVDESGEAILDADGDEVMSGPGFDYQVVKVERELREDDPEKESISPKVLSEPVKQLLNRAFRLSEVFGHPWVGTEHFTMALLETSADAESELGRTSSEVAKAIAALYEGPNAEARLQLVKERLATNWTPPEVANAIPREVNNALALLLLDAVDRAKAVSEEVNLEHCVRAVKANERPYSIVGRLLKA